MIHPHVSIRRPARAALRAALLALGLGLALAPASVRGQQLGEGMKRTGTVGITNDDERRLFYSLICTCGCPRETLGTCTCDFAHARRAELRALLEEGKTIEQIQELYEKRFGSHALAVPPNEGASKALWALPLVAIAAGALGVVVAIRRWRGRGGPPGGGAAGSKPKAEGARDALDDRLDRELEELDRR